MCNKQYTDYITLKRHKASTHEGVRYLCDQCDYQATQPGNLKKHKTKVHEGLRYPCDQCNIYPLKNSESLRKHKASVHEGVRYQCDKCDFKATTKSSLTRHTENLHNRTKSVACFKNKLEELYASLT